MLLETMLDKVNQAAPKESEECLPPLAFGNADPYAKLAALAAANGDYTYPEGLDYSLSKDTLIVYYIDWKKAAMTAQIPENLSQVSEDTGFNHLSFIHTADHDSNEDYLDIRTIGQQGNRSGLQKRIGWGHQQKRLAKAACGRPTQRPAGPLLGGVPQQAQRHSVLPHLWVVPGANVDKFKMLMELPCKHRPAVIPPQLDGVSRTHRWYCLGSELACFDCHCVLKVGKRAPTQVALQVCKGRPTQNSSRRITDQLSS